MTKDEKIEFAKCAFAEIARDCEDISRLEIVAKIEARTWRSVANQAKRNITILDQKEAPGNDR